MTIDESKVLVTGGSGMIGQAFNREHKSVISISSKDFDLRSRDQTEEMFQIHRPEYVIHLASRVGGVLSNMNNMGDFFFDNATINTNVLDACRKFEVRKVLSCLSTCIYPDKAKYPLREACIHDGPPHSSNYSYAYTKRMLDIQSRAYRKQFGCNFITMSPNNIYGPFDNFAVGDSHVIPSLIRKIYEAVVEQKDVVIWGDGTPLREFTFSEDIPDICFFLLENYDEEIPINIGSTGERSIKQVVERISEIFDFRGDIIWDTKMPSGQYRKPSDNSRFLETGWDEGKYTEFDIGIEKTCSWFKKNYPNVRGAS